jgi:hypothetical protein
MTPPRDFDAYLDAQAHNLSEVRTLPEFKFVESIAALYEHSRYAVPARGPELDLRQLLIVCHQGLLSAAATIGRTLPADSLAVTRRVAEAARLALAIKHDPDNLDRWRSWEKRLSRWQARNEGIKPKRLFDEIAYPKGHSLVDFLGAMIGMLSDIGVHLTPEFMSLQQPIITKRDDGRAEVHFPYLQPDQRELERALMFLAAIHLKILAAFDECFDGAFRRDAEWSRRRTEIDETYRSLAHPFMAEAQEEPPTEAQ